MTPGLDVVSVSKLFRIWPHPRDMLLEAVTGRSRHRDFKALDDVSFRVERGAIVGIMGRNGAGKSTLLRIVAGTLDASSGHVAVNGRVAAILELGTGFHPGYSGRENIRLGGMCLGLTAAEVREREAEIIEFSELREFIDQPFRTYSSGMQGRLTFAVATAIDPDILIIDEALSVGDARFQLKSFDRIRTFKKQGKTILFVSHDINAISALCDEAILLERGAVVARGVPPVVGNVYHELLFGSRHDEPAGAIETDAPAVTVSLDPTMMDDAPADTDNVSPEDAPVPDEALLSADLFAHDADEAQMLLPAGATDDGEERHEHRYGDGTARIVGVEFRDMDGRRVRRLDSLATYDLVCQVKADRPVEDICFGILVRDRRGTDIFGWDSRCGAFEVSRDELKSPHLDAGETAEVRVRFRNNLAGGSYFLTVGLARTNEEKLDLRFDCLDIEVVRTRGIFGASLINLEVRGGHDDRGSDGTLWRKS